MERELENDDELQFEPEEPEQVLNFVLTVINDMIETTIPEKAKVLTFEEASNSLKGIGKIWNLTEISPMMAHLGQMVCKDSEDRLLDMEGYVDEYQYLHIEAVDMALSDIRIIPKHFVWLLSVDLSGNRLNNQLCCPLTKLPNAVSLKVNRNRFSDPYLPPMKHLQYLGMNHNRIDSMHRIYHPNLETLDLNHNIVKEISPADCWKLKKLKQLELRGNQLTTTHGLEYPKLVKLYLAANRITKLEGMDKLVSLQALHLRDNPLSDLSGFTKFNSKLKYLNIRKCQVQELQDLKVLALLESLKTLVVKENTFNARPEPEEEEEPEGDDEEMRVDILVFLPKLTRIDKKEVSTEEREKAKERASEREE